MRLTRVTRRQILETANWKCEYCGVDLDETNQSIDHKVPRSQGGTDDVSNLAASCKKCNMIKADQIIGSFANPIIKHAAESWIHAYINSPILTSTISFLVAIATVLISIYANHQQSLTRESDLTKNFDFTQQIQQLNQTEINIKQLLSFVEEQKGQLEKTEVSLIALKDQKSKLEPIVNADKELIEALFSEQEVRALKNSQRERWIGFWIGIGASLIASFILLIVQYFVRIRRERS